MYEKAALEAKAAAAAIELEGAKALADWKAQILAIPERARQQAAAGGPRVPGQRALPQPGGAPAAPTIPGKMALPAPPEKQSRGGWFGSKKKEAPAAPPEPAHQVVTPLPPTCTPRRGAPPHIPDARGAQPECTSTAIEVMAPPTRKGLFGRSKGPPGPPPSLGAEVAAGRARNASNARLAAGGMHNVPAPPRRW